MDFAKEAEASFGSAEAPAQSQVVMLFQPSPVAVGKEDGGE